MVNLRHFQSGSILIVTLSLLSTTFARRPLEGTELRCCTLVEPPTIFRDRTEVVRIPFQKK